MGQKGWVEGEIDNKLVKTSMDFEYEVNGFSLPDYSLGSNQGSSTLIKTIAILTPIICTSIIIIIVYRIVKCKK